MNNRFHQLLIKQIEKNGHFSGNDFMIVPKDNAVTIKYRYSNMQTQFVTSLPTEKTEKSGGSRDQSVYMFYGTFNPGRYTQSESFHVVGESSLMEYLSNWLQYLEEELIGYAVTQRLKAHEEKMKSLEKQISEYLNKNTASGDYISREEFENISNKMDEMYLEFSARLNEVEQNKEEAKRELDTIKKEIEQLKSSAKYLSKHQWTSRFVLTVGDWLTNPDKIRRLHTGGLFIDNVLAVIGLPKTNIANLIPENIDN